MKPVLLATHNDSSSMATRVGSSYGLEMVVNFEGPFSGREHMSLVISRVNFSSLEIFPPLAFILHLFPLFLPSKLCVDSWDKKKALDKQAHDPKLCFWRMLQQNNSILHVFCHYWKLASWKIAMAFDSWMSRRWLAFFWPKKCWIDYWFPIMLLVCYTIQVDMKPLLLKTVLTTTAMAWQLSHIFVILNKQWWNTKYMRKPISRSKTHTVQKNVCLMWNNPKFPFLWG